MPYGVTPGSPWGGFSLFLPWVVAVTPRAAGDSTGSWWQWGCPHPLLSGCSWGWQPCSSHFGQRAGSQGVTLTPRAGSRLVGLGHCRVRWWVVSLTDPTANG